MHSSDKVVPIVAECFFKPVCSFSHAAAAGRPVVFI